MNAQEVRISHVNFGAMRHIVNDVNTSTIIHCLLIEHGDGAALVDCGLGLAEMQYPGALFGPDLLAGWGFFPSSRYAARVQLEGRGIDPADVTDVVLTHADVDHAGGLVDFPHARVHLSTEEKKNLDAGNGRYLFNQFDHGPRWMTYGPSGDEWMGLSARPLDLSGDLEAYLLFLPGHTAGHCGVAVRGSEGWVLHTGDVYYRHQELSDDDAAVVEQAKRSADDEQLRKTSKALLAEWLADHPDVPHCSTHDITEFPTGADGVLPTADEIAAAAVPQPHSA